MIIKKRLTPKTEYRKISKKTRDQSPKTYKAEIDDPRRFEDSRDVAAYIGLTPNQYSSGETQRQGGISKKGPKRMRCLLVEAATCLLTRSRKKTP